jgi:hypothetical protein
VEANSTGGQGSRRAVAASDDDDNYGRIICLDVLFVLENMRTVNVCRPVHGIV